MRGTCTEVPQKRHHLAIERGVVLAELRVSVYGGPTQRELLRILGEKVSFAVFFAECGISLEIVAYGFGLVMGE